MILRDPVHGLVAFEGPAERLIGALLDTREAQRLRRVRQLGLTSFVFPGAEHSRFAHALGSAHVMVRLLRRIRECQDALPPDLRVDQEAELDAIAAAFLHDLGHGPFSHLFEALLPGARHHEEWTVDAIIDPATDVNRALAGFSAEMPGRVARLLAGRHRLPYLGRAISGTLDVDRCDYLLRDSHMTGVSYGLYDLDWLLRALSFGHVHHEGADHVVLAIEGRKGLPPIEGFFLARHFMYEQVYHHKATRAAESLIRAVFARVSELVRDDEPPPSTPRAMELAARGQRVPLSAYMELDDAVIMACFGVWTEAADPTLRELAGALSLRRLPKTVPLPAGEENRAVREECRSRTAEIAARHGLRPDLTVWLDVCEDTPYEEPEGTIPDGLWILIRRQPIKRLGRASFLLGELCNKRIETHRLIFPAVIRAEVERALEGVIG